MVGKPGKSLLTAWNDDSQQSINQLWDEIEARFGICPSFFKLAQYEPPVARYLFRQAEFAYLDNPIPAHFKERLFTWLSRFCEARYCVARHCAFLLGRGRVAGDAGATPLSAEQALSLLKELMPDKEELPEYLRALEETPAPLGEWPDFDSDLGRRFRVACAVAFLDPGQAAPWLRELLRLLGPRRYEQLMVFLAFVGAEHFWAQVHPELEFEPDLEAMLSEREALVEPLLRGADEAVRSCIDITERKKVEEALRESEQRFARFMRHLPGLAWIKDLQGRYVYANAAAVKAFRTPPEELYGRTDDEVFPPEVAAQFKENDQQALTNEEGIFVVETLEHEDGVLHYSAVRKFPIPGQAGRETNIGGIAIDITESKRADEALRESEERLAGIVSSAMDAIITVDEDHRIVLFNEAAERMFGCPAAAALGQPLNLFIPQRLHSSHTEHVRHFGETGGTSRAMGRLSALAGLRADGTEFPIEAAISSVEVGGRKLYTVIHRDITERKQAEAEREQLAREQVARAAAEAANRSKDEFLAMVSHELRSPLNAILGYARMLRSGPVDRDAINNITDVVERSAKAQLQIIEDLLDSSRIVTGKLRIEPEPVDLVPALQSALDTVRSAAEAKGVTLAANFGPQTEEVLGDATRLQQVVWNLLTNAVKFTPEGGRVELRMEGDYDSVRITVSDTGRGIEPEFLPFVFDRFRQADPSSSRRYGGLGLGLSLVKHLAELHGGTITAESEGAGKGSTFTVTLPRRNLEFMPPPPAVTPSEVRTEDAITIDGDLSLEGLSVLVVDDQMEARELLTQALGEYGAQVTAVSSGAEALAFLSNPPGGERPDALILDIAMPGEDGYTVLKKVRALEAAPRAAADQIPAIALTAYGRSEDRLRALQEGFQMHVAKPVEPAELAVVIDSLTSRRVRERRRKE